MDTQYDAAKIAAGSPKGDAATSSHSRRVSDEGGQALLEFALLSPFLLVLLLLIVDFGLAVDDRATLAQAMRESGRVGASGAAAHTVIDVAVSQSGGLLEPGDVVVCYIDGADSGDSVGDPDDIIRIEFSFERNLILGAELIAAFGAGPISLDMSMSREAPLLAESTEALECQ